MPITSRGAQYTQAALKKGIAAPVLSQLPAPAAWNAAKLQAALVDLQPAWWYDYLLDPQGATYGNFCPMFTARNQFTSPNIAAAVALAMGSQGHGWLMFLNEPDGIGYSVANAITDWNTLVAHADVISSGVKLLAPPVAGAGAAIPTWLTPWLAGLNRQPDAIAVHAYFSTVTDAQAAVGHIQTVIGDFQAAFPGAELWHTEFSNSVASVPSDAYLTQCCNMACQWNEIRLATTHYAYWSLGPETNTQSPSHGNFLYRDDGTPTALGVEYRDRCGKHPPIVL